MITRYHRPHTLDEALVLLKRPNALPLGGGTLLSRPIRQALEVVDLQDLGLNFILPRGNDLEVGATITLQGLLESEFCSCVIPLISQANVQVKLRDLGFLAGQPSASTCS